MDADLVNAIIAIVFGVVALASGVAALYILWVYRQRKEEALFLTRLVHRDIRVSLASMVILGLIVLARLGLTLPQPLGGLVAGGAVVAMMVGPISDALLWRRERKAYGNGTTTKKGPGQ